MAPMISALRIPSGRVLKVRTTLGLPEAADRYDSEIRDFFRKKGRLTLALLGLGADGHTASLFSAGDLDRCKDRFAIPVPGAGPFNRVSVTPAVIRQAGRIVFLVAGNEKEEIAARLRSKPETVIAGQVVKNAPNVELWFSS
jgi:6-phosphogluconolactonase